MKGLLSFLKSPLASHAIAFIAVLISLGSFVYSCKLQNFTKETYAEAKRGNIRILLYDTTQIARINFDRINHLIASSDHSLSAEAAIRAGQIRDNDEKIILNLEHIQENFDHNASIGDPVSLSRWESELEIQKKEEETLSAQMSEIEQEIQKSNQKKP